MRKRPKVIIIGGGASGLMASIAAQINGAQVVILERMNRVGKKDISNWKWQMQSFKC